MHIAARPARETIRAILAREKPRLSRQVVQEIICQAAGVAHIHQMVLKPTRVIVAAAGQGSRFESSMPKILARGIVGRPILLRILDALAPFDPHPLVIINRDSGPGAKVVVQQDCLHDPLWCIQEQPRGTGHALLSIEEHLHFHDNLIVVWGDMGALNERLVFAGCALHQLANNLMTIPTKWERYPYVTLLRGADGTIIDVLQARRGDVVPASGEQDCGIFFINAHRLLDGLHTLAQQQSESSPSGELDFLALIGQMAACNEQVYALNMGTVWDSQGVNTLLDLHRADRSYMQITRETEHDLRSAHTIDDLLDTLAWSTIHTDLFGTLSQILQRSDREYQTETLETLLNRLPKGKRAVLMNIKTGDTPNNS
jgi:bifunctional N-acetylglucosamine-1-phosphate-uridyltransferase/glucosamine-1-phosphate-acetyltransferase GlmU-like protein